MTSRVVEYIYDPNISREDLGKMTLNNFTGITLVREFGSNEFQGGYRYKDGDIVSIIGEYWYGKNGDKETATPLKTARTSSVCWWTYSVSYYGAGGAGMPETWHYWSEAQITGYYCSSGYPYDVEGPVPADGGSYSGPPITTTPNAFYINYFRRLSVEQSLCAGLSKALEAQSDSQLEMWGYITTDNKIIIMPNHNSTKYSVEISGGGPDVDIMGRPLYSVNDGAPYNNIMIYYYNGLSGASTSQATFDIKGIFHTHPIEAGYDYDNPSTDDLNTLNYFPNMKSYIINDGKIVDFTNGSGNSESIPNWKNNCSGVQAFFN